MAIAVQNLAAWDHLLLIYSGDIANSGERDEYVQAEHLLNTLLTKIFGDLKAARIENRLTVVCVPGNHDKQHTSGEDMKTLSKEEHDVLATAERSELDSIWHNGKYEEQIPTELTYLGDFISFANANNCFYGGHLFEQKTIIVGSDNFNIRINLINTAVFTLRGREDKGLLYIPPWCIDAINEIDTEIDFVVTVMHHDPECYVYGNEMYKVKDSLKDAVYLHSSLVCIGHEHKKHAHKEQTAVLQRAGALSYNDNWTSSQFFAGILETEGLEYTLTSFEWDGSKYAHTAISDIPPTLKNPMRAEQPIKPAPRGLCVVNEKCVADHIVSAADVAIKTYFRETSDIDVILKAVCSSETVRIEDLLVLVLQQIEKNDLVFVLGDGGIGKTTLLVELAVELSNDKTLLPVLQLKSATKESEIDDYFRYISYIQERTRKQVILLVDNPNDENADITFQLLEQYKKYGIKLVFTERVNRMATLSVGSDLLPDITFFGAHAIVLRSNPALRLKIKWLDMKNITNYCVAETDKMNIVSHMLSSRIDSKNSDIPKNKALESLRANLTIHELFRSACSAYNKQVDLCDSISPSQKIVLCWDEWEKVFASSVSIDESKTPLKLCFQYIAALDLFKIKANVDFISNLTGINNDTLIALFKSKLDGNLNEPAEFVTDEDGKCYVVLKHDTVADDFFEIHAELTPKAILQKAIDYLDDETIVRFEKTVFKRKNVQGETPNKYNIEYLALINKILSSEKFVQILTNADRLYSLELAHVWYLSSNCKTRSDQLAVKKEWETLLHKYSRGSEIGLRVWRSCRQDFMNRDIIPTFVTKDDGSIEIVLQDLTDDGQIASLLIKTYGTLDDNSKPDLLWFEILTLCVKHGINLPVEMVYIYKYVDYRIVTDMLTKFLVFTYNMSFDKTRAVDTTLKIYFAIAEAYPQDIHSRMAIAKVFEEQNNLPKALEQYKYIYDNISKEGYRTLNALAEVYSTMAKNDYFDNKQKCNEYNNAAIKLYKHVIAIAPEEQKAVQHCAFGAYYRNRYMFLEAKKQFELALAIGTNDSSAHNGLAMLYMNAHKSNPFFNCDKAMTHFADALNLANLKNMVSILIPYGNLFYMIGQIKSAKKVYEKALFYKRNDSNANKMLKVIEAERQKTDALPKDINSTIDEILIATNYEESFTDLRTKNNILGYVYWKLCDEAITQDELKKLNKIMKNYRNNCIDEHDIISLRIQQTLSLLNQQLSWYQTYCYIIYKHYGIK